MDEFPDPDEEFELNYGDELEMLNEGPEDDPDFEYEPAPKCASRRSLKFNSPEISKIPNSNISNIHNEKSNNVAIGKAASTSNMRMDAVAGPSWLDDSTLAALEDEESRKRKVVELFGDIDDIDFCEYISSKKKKTADEIDNELVSKIVASRQEIKLKAQALRVIADSQSSQKETAKRENISKRVPKWPFMPITTCNGERWYLRLNSDVAMERQISEIGENVKSLGLLSTSYSRLREQAEEVLKKKVEREYEAAFERKLLALEETSTDSGCELMSEDEEALWVEKYKPRHYLDLLSDESMNRTLLQWLKLWDKVVFGRDRKVKSKPKEEFKTTKKAFHKKPFSKFEPKGAFDEELDENDCPKHKVALLCGPPGLGKTTLAHLVAKHAGYNVVEMNASDDRSPDAFRLQLEAATQMRAVMGQQPRPNCLVIDEIDGAPAASIEVLLKFLSGKDISKKKGKKKSEAHVAKRPIICICNDIYVPALRSLRQVAFVLQFPPTASSRLAQRLLEICHKQHLKTDMGTLLALAEKTHNDIRSCMSVLQFFKGRGSQLRLIDVQKSNVGQKDMQKGLFTVWQEIFQIQRPRRNFSSISKPDEDQLTPLPDIDSVESMQTGEVSRASRMHGVLQTVQSFGDYDRVAQGVFENYLYMNLKDTRMEGVFEGLEWFSYFNVMTTRIYSTQNYILMPYLPYAFVMWHFLFSSFNWPKISYPKQGYEASQRQALSRHLLQTMLRGMAPCVRAYIHAEPLLEDTLPLLLDLILPALRPVSSQLYSPKERGEMAHVVDVMLDYNLTYVQQRNVDGAYEFVLDPNIEQLVTFPDGRQRRVLPYSCKQLIAHELEKERMRRAESRLGPVNAASAVPSSAPAHSTASAAAEKTAEGTSKPPLPCVDSSAAPKRPLPNHLQKLTARPVRPSSETRVVRDFFGRVVERVPATAGSSNAVKVVKIDEIVKSPIWFHFKEGHSNAVRRPVKVHELV